MRDTTVQPYEVPRGAVVIGGESFPCAAEVRGWRETGFEFRPGRGARKRDRRPDLVVWHFTGGEGDAATVHRVLNERGLGIEFIIDRDGVIWQCCDPADVDTFDAGTVNRRSVGVEIVSRGIPGSGRGSDRGEYVARVHGHSVRFARFYPPQIHAALALAETLSAALDVPRRVPIRMGALAPHELAEFSGHLGHLHVTRRKIDPGTELFDRFRAAGFDAV